MISGICRCPLGKYALPGVFGSGVLGLDDSQFIGMQSYVAMPLRTHIFLRLGQSVGELAIGADPPSTKKDKPI